MTTFAIVLESLHIPIASDGVLLQAATFAACRTYLMLEIRALVLGAEEGLVANRGT